MAIVDVQSIQPAAPEQERILAFAIDAPRLGGRDVYDIEFAGWVLGRETPATGIEIHVEGTVIRRAPLDQQRIDVSRTYPDTPGSAISGFRTWVSVIGIEPGAALQLRAVLEDGSRVRLGTVKFTHQAVQSGFQPSLRPLMLTTMGRAGTTWTMRLLSEHPQIVIHRWHPYELRTARYWWHTFKVLSEPRDPYHSAQADRFQTNRDTVGHNPFYPEPIAVTPGLGEWMGRTYVEQLGAFCQRSAEECYQRIAQGQGQANPIYFAEKHRADTLPWLVWELYPEAKELFLVRDFRDVVSSMLAFNVKQGFRAFGPEHIATDEEFARYLRNTTIRQLARSWPKRRDRAHLIRYEDLMTDTEATLRAILAYLELDASDAVVAGMIARASEENADSLRHRTSSGSSLGRWRESLAPSVQAVCNDVYADVLEQFGYAL
ncbi:MAG: sulfotransferase [Thermomicrobiales bacterium]|nr:sulfotransferase [Thermomicrobiales bacterium]